MGEAEGSPQRGSLRRQPRHLRSRNPLRAQTTPPAHSSAPRSLAAPLQTAPRTTRAADDFAGH
jgi:hypothetical protein